MLPVLGDTEPWTDPAPTQINRLRVHVPLSEFSRHRLDGTWSLEKFEHPGKVLA